jgi:hypothetical protein
MLEIILHLPAHFIEKPKTNTIETHTLHAFRMLFIVC